MKAIFFNIPAQGHINPSIGLISELMRRGEQVTVVNSEETRAQFAPTGAPFIPYPADDELNRISQRASGGDIAGNALALTEIGARLIPWTLQLFEREKPDYVIFDSLCAWAKQAADIVGLPNVATLATFVLTPGSLRAIPPSLIMNMMVSQLRYMPAYLRVALPVQRKYGAKMLGLTGAVMSTGALNVIYTSREFQPSADSIGDNYKFVGTQIADRPYSGDFPTDQLTGNPLVYISLGTINNQRADFYRACFEAFGSHGGQFILSVGKATNIDSLGAIPPNFIVRNFVPQLEILKRANLFITHGGMNSVQESAWFGVPMVVIPQQLEQALVARRVAEIGAGIALGTKPPFGTVTAAELAQAVQTILAAPDSYRIAARRFGDSLQSAGGYVRAVDEIVKYVALSGKRK
jgi:MGT family glycosyltransferase